MSLPPDRPNCHRDADDMPLNTTDSVETFNKDEHKTRRARRELQVALKNLGGNAKLRFSTFDSNSERVGENSALIKEQERHELENGGKGSPFNAKKWLRAKATMRGRSKLSTPQRNHCRTSGATACDMSTLQGSGVKRKRPSRSTHPLSPPARSYDQWPESTANKYTERKAENEHRAYIAHPLRATTGIGSGAPAFVYLADYQAPSSREPIVERPYPFPPQWQTAASSARLEVGQISTRPHDDIRRHRNAARGPLYYPRQTPRVVDENEQDRSGRTVSPGDSVRHRHPVDDTPRRHDFKGPDTEQLRYNARPFPSHRVIVEDTLDRTGDRHQGPAHAETTWLSTRAPPPIPVQEEQIRFAATYTTSRSSEQHAVYMRVERDTESHGSSHLDMAYHETYSDIVPSDAAVYYAGSHSSSSSESSSAAVDAPCGLGPPVDTGLWRAPTAPPLTQLSANQRRAMSLASATFPSIHHHLASMHAEIDTSQANLIGQAAVYDQPSSNNACEAYLPQGWQIPNHATSVFAQAAQAAGLNYSSADLYLQNAHIPGFALSHAQGYEARFEVNTDPRQISAILAAGRQRKHAFAAEGSSPYEHQGEPTQVLHNAAPLLRPAQDHGPLVWARRDGDLHDRQTPPEHPAQMAHRQGATLHPRMTADVTSSVAYPATLDLSSAIPLKEQHYDNTDGTISYLVPQHSGPSADDPSPDAFARSTLVQRPDLPWFHEHCPYLL